MPRVYMRPSDGVFVEYDMGASHYRRRSPWVREDDRPSGGSSGECQRQTCERISERDGVSACPRSLPLILVRDSLSLSGSTVSWNLDGGQDGRRGDFLLFLAPWL